MDKDRNEELKFIYMESFENTALYSIIDKTGRNKIEGKEFCDPLNGTGHSAVIFRGLYKEMDRAIKILNPEKILLKTLSYDVFVKDFNGEIQKLSQLTHTNLSKLHDYGKFKKNDKEYLYYVMDYIPGKELDLYYDKLDTNSFFEIFDQILKALEYLHSNKILHCDIKEGNILVQEEGNSYKAILLDLGGSKIIEDNPSGITYFNPSKKHTRVERREHINKEVEKSLLKSWFPDHDLHAFGHILKNAMENTNLRKQLSKELSQQGFEVLELIKEKLLEKEDKSLSSKKLRSMLRKLNPKYLSPLGIPEMAISINIKKSVALPLERLGLTTRFLELVENPLFQRLLNISQLDFMYFLYPGAHHTRFLHSLCSFNLAKEYLSHLLDDSKFRYLIDPEDIEATLIFALLHDIGHYPLLHMFEDYSQKKLKNTGKVTIPLDDDLFRYFVFGRKKLNEYWKYYKDVSPLYKDCFE